MQHQYTTIYIWHYVLNIGPLIYNIEITIGWHQDAEGLPTVCTYALNVSSVKWEDLLDNLNICWVSTIQTLAAKVAWLWSSRHWRWTWRTAEDRVRGGTSGLHGYTRLCNSDVLVESRLSTTYASSIHIRTYVRFIHTQPSCTHAHMDHVTHIIFRQGQTSSTAILLEDIYGERRDICVIQCRREESQCSSAVCMLKSLTLFA